MFAAFVNHLIHLGKRDMMPSMTRSVNQALSRAILTLLTPLVRILLRNGVAFGSFSELAKKAYVDVAYSEFSVGRKSVSAVSALTGLTRKEARRLLDIEAPESQEVNQRYNRAVRVISGWVNDSRFQLDEGVPADLPFDGSGNSFISLVKEYSGDIPPHAMLESLVLTGAVERLGGYVRLKSKAYIPGSDPVDKIDILGSDVGELIATIDHNLVAKSDQLRYQRKVSSHLVRPEAVSVFKQLAAQKSQVLLEELDSWLSMYEVEDGGAGGQVGQYVSVGIYYSQGADQSAAILMKSSDDALSERTGENQGGQSD